MRLKKSVNIKRSYLLAFVMINLLIVGLYYTYGIFTIKQLKDDISHISINESFIKMSINDNDTKAFTVYAHEKTSIVVSIENILSHDRYFRIVHKGVPSGVMVYDMNSSSYGLLNASEKREITIYIDNTLGKDVIVEFYCEENNDSVFDKTLGYSYINKDANYDHSGANKPVYESNMIPVFYDAVNELEGVWKKADSTNNSSYIWYDYDNFMWANVVTVNEDVREKYQNAEVGTEIQESDINAFFVWIPKYKYYVINNDNTTTLENVVNVLFVGNRQDVSDTGSVSCEEAISNSLDKHLYSEICTDNKYEQIYNNLSTYTHPAFSDVDGFWIGKFANNNTSSITIKPNSLLSIKTDLNISNVRKMTEKDNIYGFTISQGYDDKTWKYTSESNVSTTPINSMEWGAVSILSNSLYGKSGNPIYQTENQKSFTRIYNNLSDTYSGRSTNYTTSSLTVKNNSVSTIYYNDLTDVSHTTNLITYPIGYRGAGASTTGTVYGVYDMAGGNYTTVMGIVMDENGKTNYEIDDEFYTKYSYIPYNGVLDDNSKGAYLEVFRLGDGIKEHVRSFTADGMWQNGKLTVNNTGVMRRGGYTSDGSIFTTEITSDENIYSTFTILRIK